MPADEKDKAATNRLLDLLRAQQVGTAERAGNESGTLEDKGEDEPPKPEPKTEEPKTEPPVESPKPEPQTAAPPNLLDAIKRQQTGSEGREISPDTDTEKPLPTDSEPESREVPPEPLPETDLKAHLKNLASRSAEQTQATPIKQEPAVKESVEAEPVPEPIKEPTPQPETPSVAPEKPVPDGPALMTEEVPEAPEDDEPPAAQGFVDRAYFQVKEDQLPANKFQDILGDIKHWLFGTGRQIAIYCTTNNIRFLKIRGEGDRAIVEKIETYPLPFETEERRFVNREELVAWVLDQEEDKRWRKQAFVALNSSQIESQTKMFAPPDAKGKELQELLQWTAKKNIPFSANTALYATELMPKTQSRDQPRQYAIAVAAGEIIDRLVTLYNEKKYNLRLITTLPVLDWKLFQHNYPDHSKGCVGIVHIGETQTSITMLKDGNFQFTREMAVGTQDYYKSVQQRVVTGDKSYTIDADTAQRYVHEYGIPESSIGIIPDSGVSMYKISIFMRPVIERMTTEFNRSLDYFRKQDAELECRQLFFTGPGAGIPNLVQTFAKELERSVEHLNPLRSGHFRISEEADVPAVEIPAISANLALALESSRNINVLPEERKEHFRFKIFNKFAIIAVAVLVPIYLAMGILTFLETQNQQDYLNTLSKQWAMLSEQSQEYFAMVEDLEIMSSYNGFLRNDRINSENQIKIMKLLSNEVPGNIKLTSVAFRSAEVDAENRQVRANANIGTVDVSGFVLAQPGIADIQLTNFILGLEGLGLFTKIERENRPSAAVSDRLFFTLKLRLRG